MKARVDQKLLGTLPPGKVRLTVFNDTVIVTHETEGVFIVRGGKLEPLDFSRPKRPGKPLIG